MISVVTSMYKSAPYLDQFYERIVASLKKIGQPYEIIFVNDGSPDQSLDKCLELRKKDHAIKVVNLSRNFGHQPAMLAGLELAKGDNVFLIDCDLEEEPELIEKFYEELKNEADLDVVYGVQKKRTGSFFRRIMGSLFYSIFNFFCDFKYVKNVMTVRMMSRRYIDSLKLFPENQMELFGLFILTGYNQKAIAVDKPFKGKSTYSLSRKVSIALDSLTTFSKKPLEMIFYLGLAVFSLSIIAAAYILYLKITYDKAVEGWVSITLSIWMLGGLTILVLGVMGLYFSKLFLEIKGRPKYIIKEIYD